MATEYGYRRPDNTEQWEAITTGEKYTRDQAEAIVRSVGYSLIAREVSEPRIVSIRA